MYKYINNISKFKIYLSRTGKFSLNFFSNFWKILIILIAFWYCIADSATPPLNVVENDKGGEIKVLNWSVDRADNYTQHINSFSFSMESPVDSVAIFDEKGKNIITAKCTEGNPNCIPRVFQMDIRPLISDPVPNIQESPETLKCRGFQANPIPDASTEPDIPQSDETDNQDIVVDFSDDEVDQEADYEYDFPWSDTQSFDSYESITVTEYGYFINPYVEIETYSCINSSFPPDLYRIEFTSFEGLSGFIELTFKPEEQKGYASLVCSINQLF